MKNKKKWRLKSKENKKGKINKEKRKKEKIEKISRYTYIQYQWIRHEVTNKSEPTKAYTRTTTIIITLITHTNKQWT